jgi:PAS domain S-box-containing protein
LNKSEKTYFNSHLIKNETKRVIPIYLFFGLVVMPLMTCLVNVSQLPKIYTFLFLSGGLVLPLIGLFVYLSKSFSNYVQHFFGLYTTILSCFAIHDMYQSNFNILNILSFLIFYMFCLAAIRYFLFVYFFSILTLTFLYISLSQNTFNSEWNILIFGGSLLVNFISCILYWSHKKSTNQILNLTNYYRQFINQPGRGYILFSLSQNERSIIDASSEIFNLLPKNENSTFFWEIFDEDELLAIIKLKKGNYFEKYYKVIQLDKDKLSLKIEISVMTFKNEVFFQGLIIDASEYIKSEEFNEQQNKKYQNLYERNLAGVFTMDIESKLINCNPAFYSILDNDVEKGEYCFKGKSENIWKQLVTLVEINTSIKNYQVDYLMTSGEKKILIFNIYLDKTEGLIEGTVVDVTDLQKATTALQHSEEKFRTLYEDSNNAIFLLDEELIIEANNKAIDIFGYELYVLQNKTLFELSRSDSEQSKNEFRRYMQRLEKNKKVHFPWHFIKEDGTTIEADVQIATLRIGDQYFNQCLIQDNTDRNRNVTNLQRSQQGFKSIIDNAPEGFIICREDVCIYANPEAYNLMNITDMNVNNVNVRKLFMSDSQHVFNYLFENHQNTKQSVQQQLYLRNKEMDSKEVEVSMVATNYLNEEAILIILKDLSVQNKLNREVVRASVAEEGKRKLESEIKERIKVETKLTEAYLRNQAIFNNTSNTLMTTLDIDLRFTQINTQTEKFIKHILNVDIQLGDKIQDLFGKILTKQEFMNFRQDLKKVLKGEFSQLELQLEYSKEFPKIWLELFLNPIINSKGRVSEISLVAHDITEKKLTEKEVLQSLKEKEVLLKEVHHRVKNNLQVISSILNLQSSFVTDEKTLDILEESRNRIRSMAMIHENLYQTSNFSSINFANYLANLTNDLISTYQVQEDIIDLQLDLQEVAIALDQAIPCGLMINEIITNALKYAFPNNAKGTVLISMREEKEIVTLCVEDNGIGLPVGFNYLESETLGLQLVATLVEQLEGTLILESKKGTKFLITFEKQKH